MTLRIFADQNELIKAAAELFLDCAASAIRQEGRFAVALAGGTTPLPLYQCLGSNRLADQADWKRIHFFWGDERAVPPDHPESNFQGANRSLLVPRNIPRENIHRVWGELDPVQAASSYQEEILRFFQGTAPRFDLILLGLGADGHTASLFPGTKVVSHLEDHQWVAANQVPPLNRWRITFTSPLINAAAQVVFLASGRSKSSALQAVLQGPYQPNLFPAQLIKPRPGKLIWLVDSQAASSLDSNPPSAEPGP